MLLKWKEEKELKKKLDRVEQAKKKPFRVVHVETEMFPFQKITQQLKVYTWNFCICFTLSFEIHLLNWNYFCMSPQSIQG